MTKKIVALVLATMLLVSCVPVSIFAIDTFENYSESLQSMIYIESTHGIVGETVEIDINISGNPGIAGAKFCVSFDENLTLVSISDNNGVFQTLDFTSPETWVSPCFFNWDSLDAVAYDDGTIITLTFSIGNNATLNDHLNIDIGYDFGDIYSENLESVTVTMVDGSVWVIDYIPGDVNSDGVVNGKDVTLIRRYNAGADVDINLAASDVNDDGVINGKDVTQIRRYNAAWDIKLLPSAITCVHSLSKINAKDATCTELGNAVYWECSKCGKCFADADASQVVNITDIVVPAKGHTVVVDEAVAPTPDKTGLTEGSHCSACHTVLIKQEEIAAIKPTYYSITYSNLQGASSPELTQYASHLGVADSDMPVLSREGYEFLGWYTEIEGGSRIVDIKPGTKQDYHLYARWKLIEYKITYQDAPITNNPEKYSINDEIILNAPQWTGLSFAYWTDEVGNQITKIPIGSTGDITLKANWRSAKNLAIPNRSDDFDVIYDEEHEQYYFIYELGTIQNVVLDQLFSHKYDGTTQFTYSMDETVSIEEGSANSVSQTIIQSITQKEDWYNATQKIEENSVTTSMELTISPTIEYKGIKASAYEKKFGITAVDYNSYTENYYQGYSNETDDSTSVAISSMVSYVKDTTTTVKKEILLTPSDSKPGMYNYVQAGDVAVFAIVTYNPNDGNYYLDTYSMVYRVFDTTIYELIPEYNLSVTIVPNELFAFDIPIDSMTAYIDSAYYIHFDSNGGSGSMPMSAFAYNEMHTLPAEQFDRAGYTFVGWQLEGYDGMFTDQQSITNLGQPGQTIKLVAQWTPIPYIVTWDSLSHGSISVERTSSPDVGASLGILKSGDTVYYGDNLIITYTPDTGYSISLAGKQNIVVTKDITSAEISAQTIPNQYQLTIDPQNGSDVTEKEYIYGSSTEEQTAPTLSKYEFVGWKYYNADNNTEINFAFGQAMPAFNVRAVAQWTPKSKHTLDDIADFTVERSQDTKEDGHKITINFGDYFDLEALRDAGYTKVTINQSFTATTTTNDGGYINMGMYKGNSDFIDKTDYESSNKKRNPFTESLYVPKQKGKSYQANWENTFDMENYSTVSIVHYTQNTYNDAFNGYRVGHKITEYTITITFS